MKLLQTVREVRELHAALPGRKALVPTMGALHAGHIQLVHTARRVADHVVVTIFVNPTQFNSAADLEKYPRTLSDDLNQCREAGVDMVFCPNVDEMYPTGAIACDINLPELTTDLEGSHRPGHFNGVCRIVAKLLNLFKPDVACFGQKDLQQLRVIEAMVDDLMMPTRIVPMPTVREADGLAMSSRNQRLSDEDRKHAVGMYKALCEAKMLVESDGAPAPEEVEAAMKQVLQAHHIETEYVAIRHPHTLRKLDCIEPAFTAGVAALVAGQVGGVRLIDNMLLGLPRGPVEMPAAT